VLSAADADLAKRLTGVDAVMSADAMTSDWMRNLLGRPAAAIYTLFTPAEGAGQSRYEIQAANAAIAADYWDGRVSREAQFVQLLRTRFPRVEVLDLTPVLDELRSVKSQREVALIRRASQLAGLGILEAIKSTKPGVYEYQLDGVARYIYLINGARLEGYRSITASGTANIWNAHYYRNLDQLKAGDLVLMDYAPDYGYYTSDIARMWPVNGKFSPVQRELLQFVLDYRNAIMKRRLPNLRKDRSTDGGKINRRREEQALRRLDNLRYFGQPALQGANTMTIGSRNFISKSLIAALAASLCWSSITAVDASNKRSAAGSDTPDIGEIDSSKSEMRSVIERYVADRGSLNRSYPVDSSPAKMTRFKGFYTEWLGLLGKMNFDALSQDGKVDYVLFRNHLDHELQQLEIDGKTLAEIAPFLPFAQTITDLAEARRRMEKIDPPKIAAALNELNKQVEAARRSVESRMRAEQGRIDRSVANRATSGLNSLRGTLRAWFGYYNAYDPLFTWWVDEPYKALDQSLNAYATFLGERVAGVRSAEAPAAIAGQGRGGAGAGPGGGGGRGGGGGFAGGVGGGFGGGGAVRTANARPGDSSDIIGDPIGREALMVELAAEMIPYTPEELIAIGHKELAWCEAEMKKASRELGYGDDWRKALEHVKNKYVEPGRQTEVIKDLALEAIEYVEKNNLVTVPPLARESWRMEMMSPERQLVNPFFTGGETISVSYPTSTMSHEQKMMSMRGNNPHFSRATVHHELIPGHHLQGFMTARYKPYRGLFSTPFWGEGWALYWELLLWDRGFAKTPEDRIGFLFWRSHRCARIIFSLSFHMGKNTPQECIDLLVNRVGHEVENATAEVRRSFAGSYGPLYQAAYLLGGLQIYSLHKDLVGAGKMTDRAFHDAILKENRIPIEMVRAILTKQPLTRDFKSSWKFYGPNPAGN
jgi:uncharacterized protein (DUF885 family)